MSKATTTPKDQPQPGDESMAVLMASLNERYPRLATPDGLYTAAEVATRYGVTRNLVIGTTGGTNWVQRGLKVSPVTPKDPRTGEVLRYFFREADVEAFVARMHAEGRWKRRGPGRGSARPPKRDGAGTLVAWGPSPKPSIID
jgi:hypothetical protein